MSLDFLRLRPATAEESLTKAWLSPGLGICSWVMGGFIPRAPVSLDTLILQVWYR